jgi:hypothetical protein
MRIFPGNADEQVWTFSYRCKLGCGMIPEFRMDISTFQFGIAIAVAPVSTLIAALVIYVANNKSGKVRADEIKSDLSAQIKELKTDLAADIALLRENITRVSNDVTVTILRSEEKSEAKVEGLKVDLKDWFRTEMRASNAELRITVADQLKASFAEAREHTKAAGQTQGSS